MALINCPHCGKPISDKAVKCPHCKKYVTYDTDRLKDETKSEIVAQSDVQSPQPQPTPIPNVAEQQEQQDSVDFEIYDNDKHSSKWLFILIAIIVILVAARVGYYFMSRNDNQERLTDNTELVIDTLAVDTIAASYEVENPSDFVTLDLSAFLLHGKVKSVKEDNGNEYSFDEEGNLIKYVNSWDKEAIIIKHEGNSLRLDYDDYGEWFESYTVIDGKLAETEYDYVTEGSFYTYYGYNTDNLPTKYKMYPSKACENEYLTNGTIRYADYDEYGNWRVKTRTDDEGNTSIVHRRIEYY